MSSSSGSLSFSGTVLSTAGVRQGRGDRGRTVVAPSAPWIEPTPPPADDFVPSHDGVLALIRDELQAIQTQLIPESPHFLCRASRVVLSLVSCHSSWVVMGVCHQHDASLLLLWLQCPASCAICVSWVVDLSREFPPPMVGYRFCIGCLICACIPDVSVVCQYVHVNFIVLA